MVTHGGHGTLMRALRAGLPLVAIPGDASADAIRSAISETIGSPAYRKAAQTIASRLGDVDGAVNAANEIDKLIKDKKAVLF